ncbi:hypothetical protein WR25_08237 [Diploscapter pachys]|uniref:Olfactomedin-like domain-containing protein n=1 Tax=Diploscapter pachys TaxID=2018661 RepID=A0A2A2LHK8_9BILA|nr:hypothetical protein WR25_08237 [Diploscapter pachys]
MFLSLVAGLLIAGAAAKPELTPQANGNKTLVYLPYVNENVSYEGRIGLFDSQNYSVENIIKFPNSYWPTRVAIAQNKIFAISNYEESFKTYDLNTGRPSRGPDPPEWRIDAFVAYFKGKLYYLGGWDPKTKKRTNRVDLLMDGIVKKYIDYQTMNGDGLKSERFQKYEIILELHR